MMRNTTAMPGRSAKWSFISWTFCAVFMAYASLVFYPRWQKEYTESVIAFDTEGYYWYLPSVFIYHNLKSQSFQPGVLKRIQASHSSEFVNGYKNQAGDGYVLKYTAGMSVMYAPGFFAGHMMAKVLGYPPDGFSPPYKLAYQLWGLTFALIGLFYFRRLMLLHFDDKVVALGLLLLVVGTNYLNYAAIDVGMSHMWLFGLYVFLMLACHKIYNEGKYQYWVVVGALCGLMTLIRPTEVIALLIPLLWGIEHLTGFKERLLLLIREWKMVMLAGVVFSAIVFVQLAYWKYASGHWIEYSYGDQGFNFRRPHAIIYSWSYGAGWLRYCPMMVLAYVGLLFYFKSRKHVWMIYVLLIINYYIVSAWNIWDYGGFSGRAMIQSYPLMFFPLLHFLEWLGAHRRFIFAFVPAFLVGLYFNVWWTYQAHQGEGVIDPTVNSKTYYHYMVGRWHLPEEIQKLKDTPELLDEGSVAKAEKILIGVSDSLQCVDKDHQDVKVNFTALNKLNGCGWIRAEADFEAGTKEWDIWKMAQFVVEIRKDGNIVKTNMFRVFRLLEDNSFKHLHLDVRLPDVPFDEISLRIWNADSDKQLCMRNMQLSGLKGQLVRL